ncbi:hypothetical protein [Serratia quinivorans]|uniref:MrpH family fimbial adhesin n=1 Tax=Serratia quinivorans TaxID=137545 RepID=UPI002177D290|nr:hypothetical protein [Serratia quinivorans]CAI1958762.1 Uncharacterised protein [Serratia quinivorans]CAI2160712.1 Uncharacterised protein [Serratia quinivorans]
MRSFVNSALAGGIPLSSSSDITNDVTARVQICLNDAGRLLIYCFEGAATSTPPVTPTTCRARKTGDIAFGTIVEKNLEGAKATTSVSLECDSDATVKVRFVDNAGRGEINLRSDIKGKLLVGGWAGNSGFTSQVKKRHT